MPHASMWSSTTEVLSGTRNRIKKPETIRPRTMADVFTDKELEPGHEFDWMPPKLRKEALAIGQEYEDRLLAEMLALDRERRGSAEANTQATRRRKERRLSIYVRDATTGVRVRSKSIFPAKYCQAWLYHMKKYDKVVPYDFPFWYGERPLVGFLSAGIWSSGGVCIEEYRADKKAGAERPDDIYPGRGDLYFTQGDVEGNIEFKMRDIGIAQTRHFATSLGRRWGDVEYDARNADLTKGVVRLGGIFLRPYVGKNADIAQSENNVKQLLKTAWEVIKPDALAWWCPTKQVLKGQRDTKDWIVGVILAVKRVRLAKQ